MTPPLVSRRIVLKLAALTAVMFVGASNRSTAANAVVLEALTTESDQLLTTDSGEPLEI